MPPLATSLSVGAKVESAMAAAAADAGREGRGGEGEGGGPLPSNAAVT